MRGGVILGGGAMDRMCLSPQWTLFYWNISNCNDLNDIILILSAVLKKLKCKNSIQNLTCNNVRIFQEAVCIRNNLPLMRELGVRSVE